MDLLHKTISSSESYANKFHFSTASASSARLKKIDDFVFLTWKSWPSFKDDILHSLLNGMMMCCELFDVAAGTDV